MSPRRTLSSNRLRDLQIDKIFLKKLKASPVMKFRQANSILSSLCKRLVTYEQAVPRMKRINRRLLRRPNDSQIKYVRCGITGANFVVLSNCPDNLEKKSLSRYSKLEILFFKLTMYKLVESKPIGQIAFNVLINYYLSVQTTPTISRTRAKWMLNMFIRDYWLFQQGDTIHFGVRSIAEVTPFFVYEFKGIIRECFVCNLVALTAIPCGSEGCTALVHSECKERLRLTNTAIICPNCGESF